jgi:hypothetical protein
MVHRLTPKVIAPGARTINEIQIADRKDPLGVGSPADSDDDSLVEQHLDQTRSPITIAIGKVHLSWAASKHTLPVNWQ